MTTSPRILVVDDESHLTYILTFKLQQAGATILSESNGLDGLETATSELPDLIISDFQMPEMNGLEMCKALAAQPSTAAIPVILLTARGHRVPPSALLDTSIRVILDKPFSIREVLERIAELLPGASLTIPTHISVS